MHSSTMVDSSGAYSRPGQGGWIVRSRSNDLGPGKVVAIEGDMVAIEYFYSPGKRDTLRVPAASVTRIALEPQTRCYLFSESTQRWQMGRVKAKYDSDYQVDLPDGQTVYLTEPHIYVRCAKAGDPMDALLARAHETGFFHAPRMRFVRSVLRQRASYRGLTALASANIELYPHQVEVIRRVLEDPIQRYLLADEVGLGKTIEAGVIIRQHLLDDPTSEVLVIAPQSLVQQWRHELAVRLGLPVGDLVHVSTVDDVSPAQDAESGMLVIDEAHHIAGGAFSSNEREQERFRRVARLAHNTERLLLLSATPASTNDRQFLAMLHLLDPETHRLDDLAGFRARVESRQAIGRMLLMLQDDADPFALRIALTNLKESFPDDRTIEALREQLLELLDAEEHTDRRRSLVRTLRNYIGEAYRIHRRMLRNRRSDWDGTFLAKRSGDGGYASPIVLPDADRRVAEAHDLIDDWRAYAYDALSRSGQNSDDVEAESRASIALLQLLLRCASASLAQFEKLIRARIAGDRSLLPPELESDGALALGAPTFDGEQDILRRLLRVVTRPGEDTTRVDALAAFLREIRDRAGARPAPKCVVFCADEAVCIEVAEALLSRLGRRTTAVVTALSGDPAEIVSRFQADRDCFVLVADRVAEEGLNLQFAEYLILHDLPWSPNALEQRIGRLDRIGRTRPVKAVVFMPCQGPSSIYEAWIELLRDGLGIFDASVAGLQFFLESRMPSVSKALMAEGAYGLRGEIPAFRDDIAVEQRRMLEQAALDEIDASDEHTSRFFTALDDLDADADAMQEAFDAWACKVLHLDKTVSRTEDHVVEYDASRRSLVPAGILKAGFASHLGEKCTFRREVAVKSTDVALVRLGHGLVDNLWNYVQWDDRGRAYAIWRHEQSFSAAEGSEWLGFKLHYVIEADTERIRDVVDSSNLPSHAWRSIQRRADALLPPQLEVLYFDAQGQEVTDPVLLSCLKRPFRRVRDGGTDTNLHKNRLCILDSLIAPGHWDWACRTVRSVSEASLRQRQSFIDRVAAAASEATRQAEAEVALLAARAAATRDLVADVTEDSTDSAIQRAVARALHEAVSKPTVRLDSVGFIALGGRPMSVALPDRD